MSSNSSTFTPTNAPLHNNNNNNNTKNGPTAPKTPTKKTNVTMTPQTPTPSSTNSNSNPKKSLTPSSTTTTPTSTSKRTKQRTTLPPIPTTLASATEPDLLILRLRDEDAAPWNAINQAWTDLTGVSVGGTTLRARYNTMKKNFVVVDPVDVAKILQAKKDIEGRLETEKWRLIAEEVEKAGGGRYPGECLRRYVREIEKEKGKKGVLSASGGEEVQDGEEDGDDVKMEDEEED
ncbi:hypothetical protein CBS63078_2208 [Aspergillus niger]|nr:hypothetical protein CBS115989_8411 [Aspergillus niger]KAI2832089.1 hypothetical protein CBS133816_1966 [Aspergillus niger]KAI2853175.1 hypothetical protein CBS11232_5450 [Aspergillus niger]KAI2874591.1 hypothetical protein CBS115988_6000 [Aspergillus niger]KAI2899782.1 hypothetical protein CBS11852_3349 [Aspergillus niger]